MKKLLEAGALTWLFGGGIVAFVVILLLLKAC